MEYQATPFELGYKMPAEWEKHLATWVSWPKNKESFPPELLPAVQDAFAEIISVLSAGEKVNVLVDDEKTERLARDKLPKSSFDGNIIFHRITTQDVWFRDYGPIFIRKKGHGNAEVALTKWKFNAWGNKYEDLKMDDQVALKLPTGNIKKFTAPIVLEGGSIDVNGTGLGITTTQCMLNRNRNPGLSQGAITQYLTDYLGIEKLIWLGSGIAGDDTDGHVDDIARFLSENTIACAIEDNKNDENYPALSKNNKLLKNQIDQIGEKLNVIEIPMPSPVIYNGSRLPASYLNFYIANKAVLVPTFNDKNDEKAIEIIQDTLPGREAIGINCRELVYGFGAIHCATQQQPDPLGW